MNVDVERQLYCRSTAAATCRRAGGNKYMRRAYYAYLLCCLMAGCNYPKREPTITPEWQSDKFFDSGRAYMNYDTSIHNIVVTTWAWRAAASSERGDTIYYHYVIDMRSGQIVDTLKNFSGKKTKAIYPSKYSIGERLKKFYLLFEVEQYRYIVTKNYRGYDIAVEYWYKHVRAAHTDNYRITVLKNDKVKQLYYIPIVSDLLIVDSALYINKYGVIYKYSFDSIINKPLHHTTKEKIWWVVHSHIPEVFK